MTKEDQPYLRDILERIQRIERYIAGGREAFLSDTLLQDGIIRNFEVIGEATKHLSAPLKERYDRVPWKEIAGMRDKVIHDYLGGGSPARLEHRHRGNSCTQEDD